MNTEGTEVNVKDKKFQEWVYLHFLCISLQREHTFIIGQKGRILFQSYQSVISTFPKTINKCRYIDKFNLLCNFVELRLYHRWE